MYRKAAWLRVVALVIACFASGRPASAQQMPANDANAGRVQEAEVRRIVDGIMQPYIAQNNVRGAIVGVSLHGHRYYFPYGQATDSGSPFTPDTLVEIGSCNASRTSSEVTVKVFGKPATRSRPLTSMVSSCSSG